MDLPQLFAFVPRGATRQVGQRVTALVGSGKIRLTVTDLGAPIALAADFILVPAIPIFAALTFRAMLRRFLASKADRQERGTKTEDRLIAATRT
jgi:hypothetical protein